MTSLFPNLMGPPRTAVATVSTAEPTEAERDLEHLIGDFPEVFDGVCRPMVGPPCHFYCERALHQSPSEACVRWPSP